MRLPEPSKDKARIDELGVVFRNHRVEQRLVLIRFLGGNHGPNRERAQCVRDRQGAFLYLHRV